MNTCSNCGKVMGLHSSILQGCMCQYSMQAPPQRTWVDLTDDEISASSKGNMTRNGFARVLLAKLKDKNTRGQK